MTTYTWTVTSIYTMPDPIPDYVVLANYNVVGTQGDIVASTQGSAQFSVNPDQVDYIPYADLTETIVLDWIQAEQNLVLNMEANIQGQIDSILNPPVALQNTPLPWVKE